MELISCIQCLKRMDALIRMKATGNPDRFAKRLEMSPASLYRYLNRLKNLGAPIQYCKESESYIYEDPFNLNF
jgi:predicted DNA-binding transcriptional regulator YafY